MNFQSKESTRLMFGPVCGPVRPGNTVGPNECEIEYTINAKVRQKGVARRARSLRE